jgi:hypothetical protein
MIGLFWSQHREPEIPEDVFDLDDEGDREDEFDLDDGDKINDGLINDSILY